MHSSSAKQHSILASPLFFISAGVCWATVFAILLYYGVDIVWRLFVFYYGFCLFLTPREKLPVNLWYLPLTALLYAGGAAMLHTWSLHCKLQYKTDLYEDSHLVHCAVFALLIFHMQFYRGQFKKPHYPTLFTDVWDSVTALIAAFIFMGFMAALCYSMANLLDSMFDSKQALNLRIATLLLNEPWVEVFITAFFFSVGLNITLNARSTLGYLRSLLVKLSTVALIMLSIVMLVYWPLWLFLSYHNQQLLLPSLYQLLGLNCGMLIALNLTYQDDSTVHDSRLFKWLVCPGIISLPLFSCLSFLILTQANFSISWWDDASKTVLFDTVKLKRCLPSYITSTGILVSFAAYNITYALLCLRYRTRWFTLATTWNVRIAWFMIVVSFAANNQWTAETCQSWYEHRSVTCVKTSGK